MLDRGLDDLAGLQTSCPVEEDAAVDIRSIPLRPPNGPFLVDFVDDHGNRTPNAISEQGGACLLYTSPSPRD